MKKYKGFVIFVIILGIYGLVMYFVFGNKEQTDDNNQNNNGQTNNVSSERKYLIIGNDSRLEYKNGQFDTAKIKDIENLDKLTVYINNKYYGDYKFKNAGSWNLFDENDEYVNHNGSLIAFSSNFNIKVRNYKTREIDEKEKVFLINNYNISTFSNLTTNEVIDFDLDNNGVEDQIICLSSMEDSNNAKNYFNIVLLKLNNEKTALIEEREEDAKAVYSIYGIINFDDSQNDSIILTKTIGYVSESPKVSNLIYNYKNGQYVID